MQVPVPFFGSTGILTYIVASDRDSYGVCLDSTHYTSHPGRIVVLTDIFTEDGEWAVDFDSDWLHTEEEGVEAAREAREVVAQYLAAVALIRGKTQEEAKQVEWQRINERLNRETELDSDRPC